VLNNSPDRPLFNRALRGVYPPGSTIKPLLGLAGLEYGITDSSRSVFCSGFYRLPGNSHNFRDWKRTGHGRVDLEKGIVQSCDVYFYDLAFRLGIDRLHDYLDKFNFGRPTGIDLLGEKPGLLPSQAWKRKAFNQSWYAGETVITGIGQGYLLVTPLQLAYAMAVLAQGGRRFQPHLLYAVQPQSGGKILKEPFQPLLSIESKDHRHWKYIVASMMQVVHGVQGTARRIGVNSTYNIAGKTGTAQVFSLGQDERYESKRLAKHLHDHALFVAFAPAEEPRIAIAVIVEHGGGGSTTAAPIAKRILDAHLLSLY
jgi:penicillin-binding protein 2